LLTWLESKPLPVSMLFAVFVKKREKIKRGEKVLAALWVVIIFFADCAEAFVVGYAYAVRACRVVYF